MYKFHMNFCKLNVNVSVTSRAVRIIFVLALRRTCISVFLKSDIRRSMLKLIGKFWHYKAIGKKKVLYVCVV